MAPRTRQQAAQTEDLVPGITRGDDGILVNERGYPMPELGDYDLEIIDAETIDVAPNKYNTSESQAWKIRVALVGTTQGAGEYAEEPFSGTIFVNKPRKDNLFYKDPNTKETKRTHAATLLETMGFQVPAKAKFSQVASESLIGGYLRGFVGHSTSGYADIRIKAQKEMPDGTIQNRGLKPVTNPDFLEANRALQDDVFE